MSTLTDRRALSSPPASTGSKWDEMTMQVPQEVRDAPPERTIVGRYVCVGSTWIGKGAFGEVWKARDKRLERWVALKLLRDLGETDRDDAIREAKTVGGLIHPNIAQMLDAGDISPSSCYLAMQLVDGVGFETWVGKPLLDIVRLLRDAANAVHFAHVRGFVHRDLKPHNMKVEGGQIYVLDFGAARWLGTPRGASVGRPVGTFAYMAPEQAIGGDVDARSDVYALGTTLYHLVTGRFYPSIARDEPWKTSIEKVVNERGPDPRTLNPEVDAELEAILSRSLEKRPENRFGSADDFARALSTWIDRRSSVPPTRADSFEPSVGAEGSLIGDRYRLERRVGRGGFSDVWRALDVHLNKPVALKQYTRDHDQVARLVRRAIAIQANLEHPHLLPILDAGLYEQRMWLVMPFVEGRSLDAEDDQPLVERVRLLATAATVVQMLHEQGYCRVDFKPANILVRRSPGRPATVALTDIDLAIHCEDEWDNQLAGTPTIMAPEQWRCARPDPRVDVYAFGAVLYQFISGRYPISGSTIAEIHNAVIAGDIVPLLEACPESDPILGAVAMRCLATAAGDRYASMTLAVDEVQRWLAANRPPEPAHDPGTNRGW